MSDEWRELVKRFADGRPICNCGQAYYSLDGKATIAGGPDHGKKITNYPHCKWGCQANQHAVKDDIARRVLEELAK